MVNYSRVQFIKITDNNKHENFYIDITTMKDARLRISALKAQYKKYLELKTFKKEVFNFFEIDWSFAVIERGSFDNYEDAKLRRDELYTLYKNKFYIDVPKDVVIDIKGNIIDIDKYEIKWGS